MEIFQSFSAITIVLLALCLLCVCAFEFINGFHDTANAVATVIYTKSLKPFTAVVYSGILNFLGMATSLYLIGPKVAMGIVKLMPINDMMAQSTGVGIALIFAILLAAIAWNFITWYLGIPCSSSHTLIGSLIGGGIAFQYFYKGAGPNWEKAMDIGKSLLLSPLFGFAVVILLMIVLRLIIKNKVLFSEPTEESKPPMWIRAILFVTCGLVSFFHGQNDGQKGLGLLLVILMTFIPLHFAINKNMDITKTTAEVDKLIGDYTLISSKTNNIEIAKSLETAVDLKQKLASLNKNDKNQLFAVRKAIASLVKNAESLEKDSESNVDKVSIKLISTDLKPLKKHIEFTPLWTVLLISFCLGLGTMIGWKRIVVTIGEKIGKTHLTYAQGASAELVAATTIGLSSYYGLPVSTTHVLSSGIAGSMVAAKGVKNLQKSTLINIGLAWLLTLPVTILLAALLFFIFHLFI
jgi:PiT family inorganic phosphate transporter